MRKLVTIRKVGKVAKHPNADSLSLVEVDGWTVITKLDEFKEGDFGVFFEIDSCLPMENENFKFLEKNAKTHSLQDFYGKPFEFYGARIKTMKLRGVVSQGLLLPLSILIRNKIDEFNVGTIANIWFEKGLDLSNMEQIGVVKYEKYIPVNGQGAPKGNFPWFVPKSDQERLANVKGKIDGWLDRDVEVTIKLDGSSMTVFNLVEPEKFGKTAQEDGQYFGICSRNLELHTDNPSTFTTTLTKTQVKNIKGLAQNIAFQGELLNTNIQSNYEKVTKPEFYVYNVYDIDTDTTTTVNPIVAKAICAQVGLDYVPVLFTGKMRDYADTYDKFVDASEGAGMNAGVKREGIVAKSTDSGNYFSFKQISISYLLREK